MNIIVISLERAQERLERMKKQLVDRNIEAVIYSCFDTNDIKNPTFGGNIYLPGGFRHGDKMRGGEYCCTISHITALQIAKAMKWEYAIILEDDIIMAEDFEKRIKHLLKVLHSNWEHVFLSGIPRYGTYHHISHLLQVVPTDSEGMTRVDGTCSYIVRDIAYDKMIKKLMSLQTTPDDMINHLIFQEKQLKSYIYFPFVSYVDDKKHSYIGNDRNEIEHLSKKYYKEKL
jgi:GR25 family glycosyltransferase involved in LPS biosynthesis